MGQTTFEKLGILYEEVDGILYPLLTLTNEKEEDIGRYGRLWVEYMKKTMPVEYRKLIRTGQIISKAREVNEMAYERLEAIEQKWLSSHRPKNHNSFIEQLQLRNQGRELAHEVVMEEVIKRNH